MLAGTIFSSARRYAPATSAMITVRSSSKAVVATIYNPTREIVGEDVSDSLYRYLFCLFPPPTNRALIFSNMLFASNFT